MKRRLILPFIISIAVYATLFVASWYYWDSGWYTEAPRTARTAMNIDAKSVAIGVSIIGVFVGLKFFIYEMIAQSIFPRSSRRMYANICFYGIYLLAAANDIVAAFLSAQPVVDGGFAALAIIFYSPVILFAGLIILSIMHASSKT